MAKGIIVIIIGIILWKIIPKWITHGAKKTRETIKLICNILGVVLILFGIVTIIKQCIALLTVL